MLALCSGKTPPQHIDNTVQPLLETLAGHQFSSLKNLVFYAFYKMPETYHHCYFIVADKLLLPNVKLMIDGWEFCF